MDHRLRMGRRSAGLRAVQGEEAEETGKVSGQDNSEAAEARGDIMWSMVKITKFFSSQIFLRKTTRNVLDTGK